MNRAEKRKYYKCDSYYTLQKVDTWEDLFIKDKNRLLSQLEEIYKEKEVRMSDYNVDEEINKKISLFRGDITSLEIDAIVNAANSSLLGGGGVDGAIHSAAGQGLKEECKLLRGCNVGDAKITGGYKLPAKHVIHTVGPQGEKPLLLQSCYKKSFQLMFKNKLRIIAFPCISTGIYGYPQEAAALVALKTVRETMEEHLDEIDRVIFCVFLPSDLTIYECLMQLFFPISEKN